MRVGIRRIDESLALPAYESAGAVAFDLASRLDMVVQAGETVRIPTNIVVAVPEGYALIVSLRSSTPQRRGLLIPNGIGVIDQDYRGTDDEVQVLVHNFGLEPVTVARGERIAQGIILPIERVEWEDGGAGSAPSRGGFGSTG